MGTVARTFAHGFAFPECPRWHNGTLWFSDQHDAKVRALGADGQVRESFDVPGGASGLGWLPNGDLLVVSMKERRLYRRRDGQLAPYAEFSNIHRGYSNDMVIDRAGRAYVGNIGFDFNKGEEPQPTTIAFVPKEDDARIAADDLICPNGTVLSPDGKLLVVAESMAKRLTAFDVASDGTLTHRRVFAELGEHLPDGICLDAEGHVWAASVYDGSAIRVAEGGKIVDRVSAEGAFVYACMLGGPDGRDLFLCCATDHAEANTVVLRKGRIDVARVSVPHAGLP